MTVAKLSLSKLCWLLTVLCCACAAGPSSAPPVAQGRLSVAVFDYENLSPMNENQMALSQLLTAKTIETIQDMDRYDVVERQQLAMVLEELNLGSSDLVEHQNQLQLGKITGARMMVFPTYQLVANQLRLDIRLVDVETGKVINAVSHVAQENGLPGWLDASTKSAAALFGQ